MTETCTKHELQKTATGYVSDSVCSIAGTSITSHADIVGDYNSAYTVKSTSRTERAPAPPRDSTMTIEAKWLGACKPDQKPGLDFLLGYGHARRALAQEELQHLGPMTTEFPDLARNILAKIDEWRPREPLRARATPLLAELTKELKVAAEGDLTAYERLHEVRILGKQLRYAMELFAVCFNDAFREKQYPAIVEMQDILGRANDSHVAVGRLLAIKSLLEKSRPAEWARCKVGIESVLRFHRRRLPEARRQFISWREGWSG